MVRKKAVVSKPDRGAQKASESPPPRGRNITRAEAVREALARGKESPGEIVDYLREQHGLEMTRQVASSYKVLEKKRAAKKFGGKAVRTPKIAGNHTAPTRSRIRQEGDILETLEALKPLIAEHGAEKVKRLVDLLG